MNNSVIAGLSFVAGLVVGGFATWRVLKTKYEQIIKEEIDSVKEVFGRRKAEESETEEKEEKSEVNLRCEDNHEREYLNILNKQNYAELEEAKRKLQEAREEMRPFTIGYDEFGDNEEYEITTLYKYSDGVIADELGNIIEDVDEVLGEKNVDTFGEYEEDTIYIQNDYQEVYFEILKVLTPYSENWSNGPQILED